MKYGTFILVAFIISNASARILQTFDMYMEGGLKPSDLLIRDEDGNGIAPELDDHRSHFLLRTDTMPPSYTKDPSIYRENNYVYLPFVPRPNQGYVYLYLKYRHLEECPIYPVKGIQCRDFINVHLVQIIDKERDVPPSQVEVQSIGKISLSLNQSVVDTSYYIESYNDGVQVVVHDEGSAFEIYSFELGTNDTHTTHTTPRYRTTSTTPHYRTKHTTKRYATTPYFPRYKTTRRYDYDTIRVNSASHMFGSWAIVAACIMASLYC